MAVVVKYADNILKGFSTSASIVVCAAFSHLLLDDRPPGAPGLAFFAGSALVVVATFMYSAFGEAGGGGSPKKRLFSDDGGYQRLPR